MSSKEIEFDGNDVVPSQDHDFRISMENLRLRDDCQMEKHITGSYQVSLRGQSSQLVDGLIKPSKRCFETVGSKCSSSCRSWQYG